MENIMLYKYLPFDSGSLKVISEGTLKYTCPLDFNDPFDCLPSYDEWEVKNIEKVRPDLIRRAADARGFSPAQRIQNKRKFAKNFERAMNSDAMVKGLARSLGVLSLSRNPYNILMWSHYADHHRGFLVEFGIYPDAPESELKMLVPQKVVYSEDRPVVSFRDGFNLEKYFLTKSLDWSYEEEERVLLTDEGPGIHYYSRQLFLSRVVAGSRIKPHDFALLEKTVSKAEEEIGREIPLYLASLERTAYKVNFEKSGSA